MDALLLIGDVERGMVGTSRAAGIREDEDALAALHEGRRLGLAGARGARFELLVAFARRDQSLRATRDFGDAIMPEMLDQRSEEHTSELQSLLRHSYAVLCLKTQKNKN